MVFVWLKDESVQNKFTRKLIKHKFPLYFGKPFIAPTCSTFDKKKKPFTSLCLRRVRSHGVWECTIETWYIQGVVVGAELDDIFRGQKKIKNYLIILENMNKSVWYQNQRTFNKNCASMRCVVEIW